MTLARNLALLQLAGVSLGIAILVTVDLLACLSTILGKLIHNKDFCLRAIATRGRAFTRFFKMALAIDWAFCCSAFLSDLCSIRCWAAFTATNLWLRNSENHGPRAWTTELGVITRHFFSLAIAALNLSLESFEVVAFALAPFAPGTFAWFWATRQFAVLQSGSLVIARTPAWSVGHIDNVAASLVTAGSTFHAVWTSTAIGAHAPILPVAHTIRLTLFCAANMVFLSTTCSWTSFAAMSSLSGDGVHPVLDTAITSCRTRTVFTPTSLAINLACRSVARSLF